MFLSPCCGPLNNFKLHVVLYIFTFCCCCCLGGGFLLFLLFCFVFFRVNLIFVYTFVHKIKNPRALKFCLKSSELEILVECLTGTAVGPECAVKLHFWKQRCFESAFFLFYVKLGCKQAPSWQLGHFTALDPSDNLLPTPIFSVLWGQLTTSNRNPSLIVKSK